MRVASQDRVIKIIAAAVTTITLGLILLLSFNQSGYSAPITIWTELADTPYPVDTASSEIVSRNGFIYVIGGKQLAGSTYSASDKVYFSAINEDGSLAGWQATSSLPSPRYLHSVAATEEHVYVIGGASRTEFATNTIFKSTFLADGDLGPWQTIGSYPVLSGINLHESLVIGDRLYVMGGFDSKQDLNLVQFAQIQANGNLGGWQPTSSLPQPVRRFSAVALGNRIFAIGGTKGDTVFSEIWSADVQPNGQLSSWQVAATLPLKTFYHEAVIHDGELVVIGGIDSQDNVLSQVIAYPIEAGNSLGTVQSESNLPAPRMRHSAVSMSQFGTDYIYVIGGYSTRDDGDNDSPNRTVFRSAPPALPTPTPTGTALPGIRLEMDNSPKRWIAPGEEILYTITYENPGDQPVQAVRIDDTVPEDVELIADSVSSAGTNAPDINNDLGIISWEVGDVGAGETGTVSYRAMRTLRIGSADGVLTIEKSAPEQVNQGEQIVYELAVTNNLAGFPVQDLVITDTIPIYATNVQGPDEIADGVAIWRIAELAGGATATKMMTVQSERTLVNSEYGVSTADGRYRAVGQEVVVTWVSDTDPGLGDGVVIPNNAQARWLFSEQEKRTFSNWVRNPSSTASFDVYLPIMQR